MIAQADAARLPFADRTFDIVIGSPPYIDARLYLEGGADLGISLDTREWVEWMLGVTAEALRVSKGLVLWVTAGVTRNRNYQPGPEGLLWEWWKQGGECECLRPVIWHRRGVPGSGREQWFRADTEYVLAFKRPGALPWADNTINGGPPAAVAAGLASRRGKDGGGMMRRMAAESGSAKVASALESMPAGAKFHTKRTASGSRVQVYIPPERTNPGNLLTGVGGVGQLGHPLAHGNEAAYPVALPRWFIASHCPPDGIVLDPFGGSGTTVEAALSLGRRGVSCDIRPSQCRLARKRVGTVTPGFRFAEVLP